MVSLFIWGGRLGGAGRIPMHMPLDFRGTPFSIMSTIYIYIYIVDIQYHIHIYNYKYICLHLCVLFCLMNSQCKIVQTCSTMIYIAM